MRESHNSVQNSRRSNTCRKKMIRVNASQLEHLCTEMLMKTGSSLAEASLVAANLVLSNKSGHDSHGVGYLPEYLHTAKAGRLAVNQTIKTVVDDGPMLTFDGQRGYGQVMAREAMLRGIDRAKQHGVALVGLRNCHHMGRAGAWAHMCTDQGLASIHFMNVAGHQPLVAPFRGSDARLGTNPVCIGFPFLKPTTRDDDEEQPPIILDMATSKIALGKARNAMHAGQKLPRGFLMDPAGKDTEDPSVMFPSVKGSKSVGATVGGLERGALISMAEHKGFGLALLSEIFGAIALGGPTVAPHHERPPAILNSMLTIMFDPVKSSGIQGIRGMENIHDELVALIEHVKDSPVRPEDDPNHEGIIYPGERAESNRMKQVREFEVSEGTWLSLLDVAKEVGIEPVQMETCLVK